MNDLALILILTALVLGWIWLFLDLWNIKRKGTGIPGPEGPQGPGGPPGPVGMRGRDGADPEMLDDVRRRLAVLEAASRPAPRKRSAKKPPSDG